jgi:NAD(P)-dependent dehydrogenase (short-subunit alcohol dehydrogenase family)
MIKAGGGSVINMASMAAIGSTARSAYGAAKGAVLTLTRASARQFVADRVRVNAIAPAMVRTGRIVRILEAEPGTAAGLETQPLGMIEPEEIGYAAVYLASDESRSVTGQVLAVHAGRFS